MDKSHFTPASPSIIAVSYCFYFREYRRKVMYGKIGKEVGEILSIVCRIHKESRIDKRGGVCPKHVHLYVSIRPR